MISDATPVFADAWWYMLFPGVALLFTVLAFNLIGDAMQDAMNPKTAKRTMRSSNFTYRTERTSDAIPS